MDTEFKPGVFLQTVTIITLLPFSIVPLITLKSFFVGILFLLIPLITAAAFVYRYRKYIVTDTCLKVVNYNGIVKSEIEYNEITNLFLQKGSRRVGQTMQVDEPVEVLVIHLTGGETVRLDLTPINKSEELVALMKTKMGW